MYNSDITCRLPALLVLIVSLTGCGVRIEGGVPPPTTPGAPPPTLTRAADISTPTRLAATPTAVPPGEGRSSAFRIGLLNEPRDLLPYHTDAGDERATAPVSELLFPSPLLSLNYSYTTTGVLERMPSFTNGDVELRQVQMYLDDTGEITTTETSTITDGQQLVITFHWNPRLRWSDGVTVTADDSLFAYQLAQQTSLGEDAERRLRLLADYQRVDDHTTRVFLQPDFPKVNENITDTTALDFTDTDYLLTFWLPLPRHVLRDVSPSKLMESDFALSPVGYGPYVVRRRTPDMIRLERNPYYFGKAVTADVVSFVFASGTDDLKSALLSGNLDVAVTDEITSEQLDALEKAQEKGILTATYIPNPIWEHLDFNMEFRFLRDLRIRQAIAYGTNREAMVDRLFRGHVRVLDSWILPDHWATAPVDQLTRYPYDPDKARALLDEAGVIDIDGNGIREQGIDHDSDGIRESGSPITLTLLTTEQTPLRASIAEQFKSDMASIGLAITVATTSTQELFSADGPLFRRGFELTQFAWIASPDPRGFELWGCTAIPGDSNNWSGSNLAGWCYRDANRAIITATTALDLSERRVAYQLQQQLFTQQLPVLPLFQRLTVVMRNPNVQGLRPDPVAPITWNITAWSRE